MKKILVVFAVFLFVIGILLSKYQKNQITDWGNTEEFLIKNHSECESTKQRRDYINCMVAKSKDFVGVRGVGELVSAAQRISNGKKVDLVGSINCHDMMHSLGKAAGLYMKSFDEAITECLPFCGGGCFHGVLEGKYSSNPNMKKFVSEACLFTKDIKKSEAHCYHGLGHAVAVQLGDIDDAFKYCDYVIEEGRLWCGSGAFMELYSGDGFDLGKIPENVPEWCRAFEGVYAEVCWLSAGYFRTGNGYLKSIGINTASPENEAIYNCSSAPTDDLKSGCIYTFGDNIYNIAKEDHKKINEICMRFDSGLVGWCLKGAAHSAKRNHPSENLHVELCETNDDLRIQNECKSEFLTN